MVVEPGSRDDESSPVDSSGPAITGVSFCENDQLSTYIPFLNEPSTL